MNTIRNVYLLISGDEGKPFYQGAPLSIDGKQYYVDLSSLQDAYFEKNPDLTLDELMSM
jgi:hypothetical protein